MFLSDVPNPFLLLPIPQEWWRPIADYDPDLRVFPSQKRPVYRLARVSRSVAMNPDRWRMAKVGVAADTEIALAKRLVLVNFSLPASILTKPAGLLLDVLKRRDLWAVSDNDASDKAADRLDTQDADEERRNNAAFRDRTRQIGKEARIAVQYRTGMRVSLVRPVNPAMKMLREFKVNDTRRVGTVE